MKAVFAEYSTLSQAVLLNCNMCAQHTHGHFQTWKLCPGLALIKKHIDVVKNDKLYVNETNWYIKCLYLISYTIYNVLKY